MTINEELKKRLNSYSKDELIDVILKSAGATAFVITKLEAVYGTKAAPAKKAASKKEA